MNKSDILQRTTDIGERVTFKANIAYSATKGTCLPGSGPYTLVRAKHSLEASSPPHVPDDDMVAMATTFGMRPSPGLAGACGCHSNQTCRATKVCITLVWLLSILLVLVLYHYMLFQCGQPPDPDS